MYILNSDNIFPSLETANNDGLLAIGGDLSISRLLLAYQKGIFPWYHEDDPICWWSPNPRCVLFPEQLKVSSSMKTILQNGTYHFSINKAFKEVILQCKTINRKNQQGTWIHQEIIEAYTRLHELGYAHSAECWQGGILVGGLYGVWLGHVFFGESMFSKKSNASKYAFIKYVQHLQKNGVKLIDCQMHTSHLETMGATLIPRNMFKKILNKEIV